MRVAIAPDSFKGSLSAAGVSRALAEGWRIRRPSDQLMLLPMADGGEGTLTAFEAADPATTREPVTVTGPDDARRDAWWALLPDGAGVVELASTSGIELLDGRTLPWTANTIGFGEAIRDALDHDVKRLILAIGSSASTDGGAGMLQALGASLCDRAGRDIPPGARGLSHLHTVDLSSLRPMPPGGVTVLTDVTNPLTGPNGAAAIFGPQKGLTTADIPTVDHLLARFADAIRGDPSASGAGAAGGTGFALRQWGAQLVSGAAAVADLVGLPAALAVTDYVVTGEGSFDTQSTGGKVPSVVADLAHSSNVRPLLVAGRIARDADTSDYAAAVSLTTLAGHPDRAMKEPEHWLRTAGTLLAETVENSSKRAGLD